MPSTLTHRARDEAADRVLEKLASAVRAAYGDRVERIVLFGSRARGDAEPDSDYDVAVFIHGMNSLDDRLIEVGRLWEIERTITNSDGPALEIIPLRARSWSERTPFMSELRHKGIDL